MSVIARGVLAALVVLAAPTSALRAQSETPGNWRWATDRPAQLVTGQDVPDSGWRFVAMPPGWHITMGPGGVLYDPAHTATGRYVLEAETFLFPEKTDQGFGLFVGGRNLDGKPEYVAFVIRHDGHGARRFFLAAPQHRHREVGADHRAAEARRARQLGRQVHRAGTNVEIHAVRPRLPTKPRHRGPAPAAILIQAEEMIEEIVARCDGAEHAAHVGPLRLAVRRPRDLGPRRRRHRRER